MTDRQSGAQVRDVKDGEWIRPRMEGYVMECCRCGLRHRMEFRHTRERGLEMRGWRIDGEQCGSGSDETQKESIIMTEFNKRYSAHKSALGRVNQHLAMAKSAHGRGMNSIAECAKVLVEATKLGKAAEGDRLARHLAAAHQEFGKAASSMDDAQAHLNQALSHFKPEEVPLLVPRGYSRSESNRDAPIPSLAGAVTPSLDDMTEGEVPQYSNYMPYGSGSKVAAATAFAKMFTGQTPGRHVITTPRWR